MSSKILMPSGGQTTDEMVILKWYKNVGEPVQRGDILFEIETDKAILTVESYAAGTLLEIRYPEGVMVKTGEVVAYIGEANDKANTGEESKPSTLPAQPGKQIVPVKNTNLETPSIKTPGQKEDNRILASPLAKSLAKIEQVKLEDVAKHVSKKVIKKDDVTNYIESKKLLKTSAADDNFYFVSSSAMRKTIARRMKESVTVSPHYIVSTDIDMTAAIILRNKLNKQVTSDGIKISFNDIIMKVAAKAIESFALINSSYEGEQIRLFKNVNFGLAIALESGIVVPVVRQVNNKSISEIAINNSENINKASNNSFREDDITGGTITLSSLGAIGVNNFTAIINQPESCILAVGGIIKKVVVEEDVMVIRDMMNITGSFDHRVIDGAVGAAFLMKVRTLLEDPELLLF